MDVSEMKPGDMDYRAYVGRPAQYDFMGASQFRLLCALGLRANHYLLDFGCGSLRAGRLFLSYLDEGRYYGIEPNKWLIEDAVKNQIGQDMFDIKKPTFDHNDDFHVNFPVKFDFILAQSILSHTGSDLVRVLLASFREALKPDGLIAVTFVEGLNDYNGTGWVYPGIVNFSPWTIRNLARGAGLYATRIPWYHPRQTWYVLAPDRKRLPTAVMKGYLKGAVLFEPEFAASWQTLPGMVSGFKKYAKGVARSLPVPLRNRVEELAKKWPWLA